MRINRRFTTAGRDVFESVQWTKRSSRITNADGSVVFEMTGAEVPSSWSQLATDIMVSKYFRKAGVPQFDSGGEPLRDDEGQPVTGPERSARQVIARLAGCWRHWGETHGYFDSADDAAAFEDELIWMMLHQVAAPNSPQWFNTGLNWAYGISGPPQGHWIADPDTGEAMLADDAYSHPQPHACFIQSIGDDLVNEGGIMDLWTREARLFKYGSGTGTNFSALRGEDEPLSGGGKSSGLMSFLKIGDRAAGAIKSGGTTRRAAKMVCLDVDHPDIEHFVTWKVREELKVAALVEGLKVLPEDQRSLASELGLALDYDFNGEAYQTVSGQNSNNSIRLTDAFLRAVETDDDWDLIRRTDGAVARTIPARDLWQKISFAAWRCADPGVQFDSTINAWHTCPASGRINASNPCSEYMFLDDTACNLASINLIRFFDPDSRSIDLEGLEHAVEIWTVVLEISVLMAAFPSRAIAERSWRYRTLGLGYANLGALLMQAGIPYDSDAGRAVCGAITSVLCGRAYATSARMAEAHGPFPGFVEEPGNRDAMLRVIRNHRRAARGAKDGYEDLEIRPVPIDHAAFAPTAAGDGLAVPLANAADLLDRAVAAWDDALELGEAHGYRNAQVTVIAPTGTIGLLMDCDTTGVEPDFALVKFKKLAGGGYFKIANASLRPALATLGYTDEQIADVITWAMGTLSLDTPLPADLVATIEGRPATLRAFLEDAGYTCDDLVTLENVLPTVFDLSMAFSAWSMPGDVLRRAGVDPEQARSNPRFNGLEVLGLERSQIDRIGEIVCGTQTVEGAPHLLDEHLAVFDCANACGPTGTRFIRPEGHIRMMAAAQPFISGAISKTINLPRDASVEDVAEAYWLSWRLGLKANALYRDGSKLSQPLNTSSSDVDDDAVAEDEVDDDGRAVADESVLEARSEVVADVAAVADAARTEDAGPQYVERIVERIIERPMRRRLPDTRRSVTHRFNVAGHEGYLTVGLYNDGQPGELFITMSKEGSTIGGLMDSLGTAISVALQYGVPLESLVRKFAHQRFEPCGITTNKDVPFAKSLVDYIFRWLGMEFIEGYREQNAPHRGDDRPADRSSGETKEGLQPWIRPRSASTGTDGPSRANAAANGGSASGIAPARTDAAATSPPARPAATEASRPHGTDAGTSHRYEQTIVEHTRGTVEHTNADSSLRIETDVLSQSTASLQSDAPACEVCGAITVRNGSCYKCVNCGNSMGCS